MVPRGGTVRPRWNPARSLRLASMSGEPGGRGRLMLLNDGRTFYVREPHKADLAGLHMLDGVPFAYFARWRSGVSLGSPPPGGEVGEPREPDIIAALGEGLLVAAAWLDQDEEDRSASEFGLAIQPAFRRAGIAPVLLRELARRAVLQGVLRMRSYVGQGTRDPLNDCRGAGLAVLSAMSFGGVTELVLGAHTIHEAAIA